MHSEGTQSPYTKCQSPSPHGAQTLRQVGSQEIQGSCAWSHGIPQGLRGESCLLMGDGGEEEQRSLGTAMRNLDKKPPRFRDSLGQDVKSTRDRISLLAPLLSFSLLLWALWECVPCLKFPKAEFAVRVHHNTAKERAGWSGCDKRAAGGGGGGPCSSWSPCSRQPESLVSSCCRDRAGSVQRGRTRIMRRTWEAGSPQRLQRESSW